MTAIRLDEATVRALAKAIADELEQRPVLLTRQQAAKALGVSVQFFDAHVRRRVPPIALTGAPMWSRTRSSPRSTASSPRRRLRPFLRA